MYVDWGVHYGRGTRYVCMCMCIYTLACVCVCVCVCVHVYLHVGLRVCVSHACVRMCPHVFVKGTWLFGHEAWFAHMHQV